MKGISIQELTVGEESSFSKTITEYDVYNFAGIVGDFNSIHINDEYAKKSIFGKRIAHGVISAGLISTVIGNKLPGEGTIYLKQNTTFLKPVYFNDTITAIVKVVKINIEKNRVLLETKCLNQNKEIVLIGESEVMPPK